MSSSLQRSSLLERDTVHHTPRSWDTRCWSSRAQTASRRFSATSLHPELRGSSHRPPPPLQTPRSSFAVHPSLDNKEYRYDALTSRMAHRRSQPSTARKVRSRQTSGMQRCCGWIWVPMGPFGPANLLGQNCCSPPWTPRSERCAHVRRGDQDIHTNRHAPTWRYEHPGTRPAPPAPALPLVPVPVPVAVRPWALLATACAAASVKRQDDRPMTN